MKEKRPRPSYKNNFNIEQEGRNRKRQNRDEIVQERNNMENTTQEKNNLEDPNMTQEENSEESEIDLPKRKKIKRSEMINDLLEELSQEELREMEEIELGRKEILGGL